MERVVEILRKFLDAPLKRLKAEFRTGNWESLRECPSYGVVKALVDALQRLELCAYGKPVTDMVVQLVNEDRADSPIGDLRPSHKDGLRHHGTEIVGRD